MDDQQSDPTFRILGRSECYQKLAAGTVGRLGVIVAEHPMIVPVNYALDGESVVIRTAPGTIVAQADQAKVTVQIDQIDIARNSGWSVLLRGRAAALTDEDTAELIDRTKATGVTPIAPGERQLWIRVTPTDISGRRIEPGADPQWTLGYAAYM